MRTSKMANVWFLITENHSGGILVHMTKSILSGKKEEKLSIVEVISVYY